MKRRRPLAAVALLALLVSPPSIGFAAAQGRGDAEAAAAAHAALSPAEWDAIQKTIGEQLEALRAGDAARAYAFASPGIQLRFQDAQTFLRMVQDSYAALLDARHAEFLDGAVIDGRTIQPLRQIATRCRFSFPENLIRAFRAAYGMSPRQYRLKNRIVPA